MNPPVRSKVADVSRCRLERPERIWVDTSVWIKLVYTRSTPAASKPYADFLGRAIKAGCSFVANAINLAEVGKHIESTECALWCTRQPGSPSPGPELKRFRALPAERENTLGEIRVAWKQMLSFASLCIDAPTERCVLRALDGLDAGEFLDAPDALQLADARRAGIRSVLTHDRDFATATDLVVYTALRSVIDEARSAALLLD